MFSKKVLSEDTMFTSPTEDRGPPFYVVIRATRRFSRLWPADSSAFISHLFQDPEYWSGPGYRTRHLPLCSESCRGKRDVSSVSGHISDCPGNVQLMLRLSQPCSLQDSLTSFFLEAREGTLFMNWTFLLF